MGPEKEICESLSKAEILCFISALFHSDKTILYKCADSTRTVQGESGSKVILVHGAVNIERWLKCFAGEVCPLEGRGQRSYNPNG